MIDSVEKLTGYLPALGDADWVAVDTEADSLHAYPEKICLIQISTPHGDRLVDPLAGFDLQPLLQVLGGHELLMHGADYDLRLFSKHYRFVPKSIFDTMLAARLLGDRQFSFSALVEKHLGVKLEKGPQKANWAMRPLTERMERYARNDTHYLKPLVDRLRPELESKGRLDWHRETCARLVEDGSRPREEDPDAWRVKGSFALGRPGLAVLRELWRWREQEATASNRPPFFILSHETMVALAAAASARRPIEPLFSRHLSDRRRSGIRKAVEKGLALPPDQHPRFPERHSRRPTEAERKRYLELEKHRNAKADQLGIDPTLIASRATLSDLAQSWDKHVGELMNWQRELLR
ncbi:MAG: HRDC domain-containing protein [Verrucomicrobiota bacterium]